jgi:osmotically-inducible protein OsmY
VVLYGTVFDESDRVLTERTAINVRGVKYVTNNLTTISGQWMEDQMRINNALLQISSLQGVSARVIGSQAYLSGQVNSEYDKARAARVVSSFSNLKAVNLIRVVPGPLFSVSMFE